MTQCVLHLVRHASHGLLGRVLTGRDPGLGLSEQGAAEAAALAKFFAGQDISAVVTSPVQRAVETAAPIAAALRLQAVAEVLLEEVDFGAWTGQDFTTLAGRADWTAWNRDRGVTQPPDGETMLAVQARAMQAVRRIAARGGAAVVVSHGDVIKSILAQILGMPLDLLHRLTISPAGRSVITLAPDHARVEGINLLDHL